MRRRSSSSDEFAAQRQRMVERQLRGRGISDERVLEAMGTIPRELFVRERDRSRAYYDGALGIGSGQTISQPWIVAAICQGLALGGDEKVLDIGAGSGYSSCVLGLLAREVIAIERIEELARGARERVERLGADNVRIIVADGSGGLPEEGPFEGIAVHAATPGPPTMLLEQLVEGGRLVAPIATRTADMLTAFERLGGPLDPDRGEGIAEETIGPCRFVPLIGREGYAEPGGGSA